MVATGYSYWESHIVLGDAATVENYVVTRYLKDL